MLFIISSMGNLAFTKYTNRVEFTLLQKLACNIERINIKTVLKSVPNIEFPSDVLGVDQKGNIPRSSPLFYILPYLFGKLLDNDPDIVLSKRGIWIREKLIHKVFLMIGYVFLNGKKLIIEKKYNLPKKQPIIFASNHSFLEDAISTLLLAERQAYFLFGSLPQFFNTFNGIAAYLNGSILVNRKNKASRNAAIQKAVKALQLGTNLIVYPEGVWNKTANKLTLNFWPGIFKIAKQTNALIVPIVHLLVDHTIYSSRLPAFDVIAYSDNEIYEAIEDLQTIFNTELMQLIENHAKICRNDLLEDYDHAARAYEDFVRKQVATAGKFYDYSIETSADFRPLTHKKESDVWTSIAQLNINQYNANDVLYAQKVVRRLQLEDYQRRF